MLIKVFTNTKSNIPFFIKTLGFHFISKLSQKIPQNKMRLSFGKNHVHGVHAARALRATEHVVISFKTMMLAESDGGILTAIQEIEASCVTLGPKKVHYIYFPHYFYIGDEDDEANVARNEE